MTKWRDGDVGQGTRRMSRDPGGRRMSWHEINSTSGDHVPGTDRFSTLPTEGWVPVDSTERSAPQVQRPQKPQRDKAPDWLSKPPPSRSTYQTPAGLVQVRCGTPTVNGVCNRWQFQVGAEGTGRLEFRCKHCKETTLMWSSEASLPIGQRNAVRG